MQKLQDRWRRVFSKKPGITKLMEHQIKVKEEGVVRLPPCRWPKRMEEPVLKVVKMMQKRGVTEPSQGEWGNNPVRVPKADGSIRVCLDFRQVNEVSKFNAYPIPQVQELLERLGRPSICQP